MKHQTRLVVSVVLAAIFLFSAAAYASLSPQPLIALPDATISCSHASNFIQGQVFRFYSIVVSNIGLASTSGMITVTDTLPAGLTAASIGGSGWLCSPSKLTCTRSDALASNASYPAIKLSVNVATNAPGVITNVATVTSSPDKNGGNNTASDLTTVNAVSQSCGTFAPPNGYATFAGVLGNFTSAVAIAEVNGDGIADLVFARVNPDSISVVLGSGNGGFGPSIDSSTGPNTSYPVDVEPADFNGDGIIDLAVVNRVSQNVSILTGAGDGTFNATSIIPTNAPANQLPVSVAVADLNGDGKLDLAIAGGFLGPLVMMGNGDGTFGAATNLSASVGQIAVAAADFNGDGTPDLAVADQLHSRALILIANGGTFNAPLIFAVGSGPSKMAIGDFNGDGKADIAVANITSSDVSILVGDGTGSFSAAVSYPFPGTSCFSLALGDFNGDGKIDLAVGNQHGASAFIRLGNGDGTFGGAIPVAANDESLAVAAGDLDGDGKTDLAFGIYPAFTNSPVYVAINACSDLAISKSHGGNFTQGQTGAAYTISVVNNGGGIEPGPITVTDTVPVGLTPTALSGAGWTCSLATVSCTHDSFSPGQSSAITLTVTVNSNAASIITNNVALSATNDINKANDSASDQTTVNAGGLIGPTNVIVASVSATNITLSWNPVPVAVKYRVYRADALWPDNSIIAGEPVTTAFTDVGLTPNTAHLYSVVSVDTSGAFSGSTNMVLATATSFTDDPAVAGMTTVNAIHLTELRAGVDAVRAFAGLAPGVYTDASPAGAPIKAVHINELRAALAEARALCLVPALTFTDAPVSAGGVVKAVHIQELRSAVRGLLR